MFDLDRIRRDTPAAETTVFLDSAGSSLPPTPVVETAVAHLRREAEVGGYRAANERMSDLAGVKSSIATLIGAHASDIALSDSATRAWSDFFYSIPLAEGDRVLLCEVEYASNAIAALQRAEAVGAVVEFVPSDPSGQIDLDAFEKMLDDSVRVVSLVHAPTNGGLVNPAREVAELAHRHDALVLLDACQSIGQIRVDVDELGVDALSATGRKWLRGPRGTGFLYMRPELATTLEPPALDLHSAQWTGENDFRLAPDVTRFEFWECDVAARLALGTAVDYLLDIGIDNVQEAVVERAEYLRAALRGVGGVTVHDLGERKSGIVSFTVDGKAPIDVRDALAQRNVTVTVSHRRSTLVDMTQRGLDAVVRASPHYFVTVEQLDEMVAALRAS
ncbi:aminotransferase class V-fold PLP-dependent enzyme [Rhodococcus sp. BP-252]|uniref:aminotransferase class V-fold PLP-dependent enzyme n=1 Tax=unclassified Rhodococcus (in: high G+C Gram-positive bacteria) TaxID=192944 RepID=UPI001430B9E8|nr:MULTISPECIES: aminotransferase class V-fold PLP-dependent enzyme [unclassified Rhodococcus (in: high G+C Gram-positive bacteria)]MBY6414745.1 aminotransferase class V-fold PLP-dependent enzyme [Rhodococcus sp. BP-320]MBY6419649.1 aminotransferase class V-fold PLP-dependent enzyme [Rhodococcus sp. BP-321]MBY6424631.1 aminotransferase class V-fold PLP-dependent enzyme [Rhodococcus sp. BP-324]MBY6429628.1 aminotransferase class V-fold PLP-dependent enzyme [Rhodococcus sp. BP-323]MBY6434595.1 a